MSLKHLWPELSEARDYAAFLKIWSTLVRKMHCHSVTSDLRINVESPLLGPAQVEECRSFAGLTQGRLYCSSRGQA